MATITNTLPGTWKVEGEYDTIIITAFLTNGGEELFAVVNTHDYTYMNCATLEKAKEWAEFYADNDEDGENDEEIGDGMTDVEADADTLASAGYGTDEDYGCFDSGDY